MIMKTSNFLEFGKRLRDERKRLGLTQDEFAHIGGVSRGTQFLYEQSSHPPSIKYLDRIVEHGVDYRYLVLGEHYVERGEFLCIKPGVLDRAMVLADQICRDDRGLPLDPHIRHNMLKEILIIASEKAEDEIDWKSVEAHMTGFMNAASM